jgi:hypothetical protein
MTLQVIGAGFGRTGTQSLKVALEELGFGKCYHMQDVMKNPGHLTRWVEIMEGGKADWDALFSGYQSGADWPLAAYYKELIVAYYDSKVILTVRDPERWYESLSTTLYQVDKKFSKYFQFIPPVNRFFKAMKKVIWEGTFHNRLEDKAYAIEVFNNHIEEVKRAVPKERLLIFEARQGWEPLCAFLGVPFPTHKPFPHVNDGATWRWVLRYGEMVIWGVIISIVALLSWLVWALLTV